MEERLSGTEKKSSIHGRSFSVLGVIKHAALETQERFANRIKLHVLIDPLNLASKAQSNQYKEAT